MKKITALFLTLIFVFALSACAKTAGERANKALSNAQNPSDKSIVTNQAPTKEATDAENEDATQATSPVSTPEVVATEPKETKPAPQEKAETTTKAPQTQETKFISRDKAIEIALKTAGLARGSVYELEAEFDKERTGTFWEVDFETREYEYTYYINAETGKIANSKVTPEKDTPKTTKPANKPIETPKPTTPATDTNLITRDRAIEIALENAGLAKGSVYELEAELDKERTGTFWEVDFETREFDYSYEINAESGMVVRHEKERND